MLIYESGTIGAKPDVLPLSIGDGELADTADAVVSVPEIFAYWLQGGRCDVGFLGAAQLDRFANINTTAVSRGEGKPEVRLPGAGGAPEIGAHAGTVLITVRHSPRVLVEELDFVTTMGHGRGGADRDELGLRGEGPEPGDHRPGRARARPATPASWRWSRCTPASTSTRSGNRPGGRCGSPTTSPPPPAH